MQAARFSLIRLAAPQRGGKGRFVIGTQEPKNLCAATPRWFEGHWPKMIKVFCNSQAVQKIKKVSKNKEFFFEKKNQKTFAPLREVVLRPLAKNY
jgi:hypothetical protein